jgi:outer membrane protein
MKRLTVVALMLAVAVAPARAQTPPVRLTLDEAVTRGIETSHRLAEIDARGDAARAVAAGRDASGKPQIALLGGYTRTSHVPPFGVPLPNGQFQAVFFDVPDNFRSRLDLQWPIYTGGRVQAMTSAARSEAEAVGEDAAAARADLKLEITRAYWAVLTAGEASRVVEESLAQVGAHLNDVRNRRQAGLVPPSDVLNVEAQYSRQQLMQIEARNTLETVSADFRRLVGLDPGTPFALADRLEAPVPPPSDVGALVDAARSGRAERQAMEKRIAAAMSRISAASGGKRPQVGLGAGYDYARPNPRFVPRTPEWNGSFDASVNVSWSLWDAGRVGADVAEARANQRAARERLQEFDRTLEVEVRQRVLDLDSSTAAIGVASDAVRSAAEARRVMTERFAAGVATNTEVLDAQVAQLQAELDRTRALANARMAAARLERALGR